MRIFLEICAFSVFLSSVICQKIETIVTAQGSTDGLFWLENQLFYVDTYAHKLCSYDALTGYIFCARIGNGLISFAVPVQHHPDRFVVGSDKDILLVQWNSYTNTEHPLIIHLGHVDQHIPGNRISYGTVDPLGRLWFGTTVHPAAHYGLKLGSVYSLNANGKLKTQIENISLSSGFVWDLHTTFPPKFYYVDAQTNKIVAYNYHTSKGTVGKNEVIFDLHKHGIHMNALLGRLTIDRRGWLWVPLLGGSHVLEIDPHTGLVHRIIPIPAARVSACTFGGPKFDVLFVSTIGYGYHSPTDPRPEDDLGGHIFAIHDLGVSGYPTRLYWLHGI